MPAKKKPPAKKAEGKKPAKHKCPPPTLKEARRIVAEAEGKPASKPPPMPKKGAK